VKRSVRLTLAPLNDKRPRRVLAKHVLDKGLNMARDGALLCLMASSGTSPKISSDFKALVKSLANKACVFGYLFLVCCKANSINVERRFPNEGR